MRCAISVLHKANWLPCCSSFDCARLCNTINKIRNLGSFFAPELTVLIIVWRTWVLFVGPPIMLFLTSGDESYGGGSLGGTLPCLYTMDSLDSPLV